MENKMTHFDSDGNAVMVDVSEKSVTERTAVASGNQGEQRSDGCSAA